VARYREHGVPWPTTMKTRPFWFYRQSGVIPCRISDGAIEVLLVSSRGGARWVVPKGVVEIGMSPVESACKEAYEEGGVRGNASEAPIGEYTSEKWGATAQSPSICSGCRRCLMTGRNRTSGLAAG
jgi:phosphohistidine phosphatase